MARIDLSNTKSDRALVLLEKGLDSSQIAERLGVSPRQVMTFVRNALKKRERLARASQ